MINNSTESNKLNIANGFNKYFAENSLNTSKEVPSSPHNCTHYLPNSIQHSMF